MIESLKPQLGMLSAWVAANNQAIAQARGIRLRTDNAEAA